MFTFVTSQGRVLIRSCTLAYAKWLVNSGRVVGGVYQDGCQIVYL